MQYPNKRTHQNKCPQMFKDITNTPDHNRGRGKNKSVNSRVNKKAPGHPLQMGKDEQTTLNR